MLYINAILRESPDGGLPARLVTLFLVAHRSSRVEEIRKTSDALIRRSEEAMASMRDAVERTRNIIERALEVQAAPASDRRRDADRE